MKITKDYLKELILESLQEVGEVEIGKGSKDASATIETFFKEKIMPLVVQNMSSMTMDVLPKVSTPDMNEADIEALEKELGATLLGLFVKHKNSLQGISPKIKQ